MINYIKYFKKKTGGLENFSEDLLLKLKTFELEINVLTPKSDIRLINILNYVISVFYNKNVTIVHYGNFIDVIFVSFLSFLNIKTLVICHVGKNWKHIKNNLLNKTTNYLLNSSNIKVLTIAEDQRNFLNFKTYKIPTITNKFFFKLDIKNNTPKHILFLGRVSRDKGVYNLLKAYKILFSKNKNLPKLLIVGPFEDNNYKKKCLDFCNENKLSSVINFRGPIYDLKLKINLIDQSLFGVYPSFYDAFPLTLIEFYSRKKILLCSNISESVNFVNDSLLLIDPYNVDDICNKINRLLMLSNDDYIKLVNPLFNKTKNYDGGKLAYKINNFSNDIF